MRHFGNQALADGVAAASRHPGRSVNRALQPADLDWASQAAIVFVDSAAIRRVIPNIGFGIGIGWSALKLLLREVHDIAAQPGVVRKLFPGQRMIVRANAKKATKRHYGIGDLPRALVDHEVVHRPEPLSARIVNGGSFYLVGSHGVGYWYRLLRTPVTQGGHHGRGGV